jgi:kynurenine formamidase
MIKNASYFVRNPGLSTAAAKYLVSKKINLVGTDSPSIDLGKDKRFPAHHIFSKNNILIVENLANLEKIRASKFHFVVLPLKLKGATGSPVRAIAFVE